MLAWWKFSAILLYCIHTYVCYYTLVEVSAIKYYYKLETSIVFYYFYGKCMLALTSKKHIYHPAF